MKRSKRRQAKSDPAQETLPGSLPKGAFEQGLDERYGHTRKTTSQETTGDEDRQGASDVGEDLSSGGETIAADPTRFPEQERPARSPNSHR